MTNYIEEMIRTAGVDVGLLPIGCTNEGLTYNCCIESCIDCTWYTDEYNPYFIAEKQLEIIKLLSKNEINGLYFLAHANQADKCKTKYVSNKDFSQALAQLTTELMNAGKLDKEKVKEILEL